MLSLFAFRLVSTSVSRGARSVVGGGRLILNTAFPRLLLPLESVLESFMRFLPTLLVFAVVHVAVGLPIGPSLLWAIPIIALITVFGAGAAMFTATSQVYFRDLTNFLPYFTRIWLYTSPSPLLRRGRTREAAADPILQPDVPVLTVAERRGHRRKESTSRAGRARPRLGDRHSRGRRTVLHLPGTRVCDPPLKTPAVTASQASPNAAPHGP